MIGDLHFGSRGNSEKFNEQVMDFLGWCCDLRNPQNIDTAIQVGDWNDARNKMSISTLNTSIEGARMLSDGYESKTYTLLGNHDIYHLDRLDVTSLASIREYTNLVSEPTIIEKGVMLVPWVVNQDAWDEIVNLSIENGIENLIGHFEFKGFEVTKGHVMEHGNTHKALKHVNRIITGHYHSPQKKDNVQYIGTPYPITMSEANEAHGVWILDTDKDTFEFIEYDKVKVLSVPYTDINEDYLSTLDPENTSIRVEFPDGYENEEQIDSIRKNLTELNFSDVKIKHTSMALKEMLESDVQDVESVENIDEVVLKFIQGSTTIEGIDKNRLEKFYTRAMEAEL